jgi:hypothetical protein
VDYGVASQKRRPPGCKLGFSRKGAKKDAKNYFILKILASLRLGVFA